MTEVPDLADPVERPMGAVDALYLALRDAIPGLPEPEFVVSFRIDAVASRPLVIQTQTVAPESARPDLQTLRLFELVEYAVPETPVELAGPGPDPSSPESPSTASPRRRRWHSKGSKL